jgi:hypothetical protein
MMLMKRPRVKLGICHSRLADIIQLLMVFAEIIAITSVVTGLRITFAAARFFREGTLADLLLIILCLTIRLPHRQRLV